MYQMSQKEISNMEWTIEQALQQGVIAHKEGKLKDAERLYRTILQSQPKHPDANHNLGVLAVSINKTDAALPLFKTALEANSKIEQFWLSYIDALIKEKHFDDARQVLKQAKKQGVDKGRLNALEAQLSTKTEKPSTADIPPQELLSSLIGHYKNGRYRDAERLSVEITQDFPKHQFAWKVLGAVLGATGRKSEAVDAYQTAIMISPKDASAHYTLGNTLKGLGKLDEALVCYNRAVTLKADFAEAYNDLSITLKELERLARANAGLSQAEALKSNYAEAHSNLGNMLKGQGRLDEAETSYSRSIALRPQYAVAHYNLGNTLKALGKLDEAEASYKQALALRPDLTEAHNNLGYTLQELGRLDEAEASYTKAIALKPNFALAHQNLGITLQQLGKLEEAEAIFKQAIALEPNIAEAHCNLGVTLKELGRLDEAEASYKQAIALKPDYAEAHRMLTSLKKFDRQDEQYSRMLQLYLNENIPEEMRCQINFGLAKACEDLENFEQAFTHYSEGNKLRRKLLKYDIKQDSELFKKIKSNHPLIEQHALEPDKLSWNLVPIFIVGMPRSGTTLVEQIISSHSTITGAGELPYVSQFGSVIANGSSEVSTEALLDFRHKYLEKLEKVSSGKPLVTDKMPQNFLYLGLLASAFPGARIVHVKRNPAAVCWSNYKQYFAHKSLGYCYSIDDIISYHKLYKNLMDFWVSNLSISIYDLDYELLTIDQENETRKLIQHLSLDWDDKCLYPQKNSRSVATASNVQVREKVYRGSSEQWKKYRPFLRGALDDLLP